MSNTKKGQEFVKFLFKIGYTKEQIKNNFLQQFRFYTNANHLNDSDLSGNLRRCISKIENNLV